MIYTVRGQQVMLDSGLAELYGVETKALNQAVSRNSRRFPERFCFRIAREEAEGLRSQIVTLDPELGKQDTWWRYMPRVFTEQGVSMLSAVLRSDTAIDVSVRIMDAFVVMRHFIADNAHMFEQIRSIDHRLDSPERSTDERFERVFDYMGAHEAPNQKVFFEGQVYDAFELLVSLAQRAKRAIVLIDGYVDTGALNVLVKKQPVGSAAFSASMSPPCSPSRARAAFTFRAPASCSLKSVRSDSLCSFSWAISPFSASVASVVLAASAIWASSSSMRLSRSASCAS